MNRLFKRGLSIITLIAIVLTLFVDTFSVCATSISYSSGKHEVVCTSLSSQSYYTGNCPCERFDDVGENSWYHDPVVYAISNNLMNGISERRFDPSGGVTRAMLVTILYRSEGLPSVKGMSNPFTDVKEGNWYTDAIIWAANNKIVNGMTTTTFVPDAVITREQIATILYRYAKFQDRDVTLSGDDVLASYPDADEISDYAVEALTWAIDCGIINGIYGTISAKAMAIRAQIATMLMRYLEN